MVKVVVVLVIMVICVMVRLKNAYRSIKKSKICLGHAGLIYKLTQSFEKRLRKITQIRHF